jgi:Carbohydrate binding module (family 35)
MFHRRPRIAIVSIFTGPALVALLSACSAEDTTPARSASGGSAGSRTVTGMGGRAGSLGTGGSPVVTGGAGDGSFVGGSGATGTGGTGGASGAGGDGGSGGDAGASGAGGDGGQVVVPPPCVVPESGGKDLAALVSGPQTIEAEDAELTGSAAIGNAGIGWTGKGYADMVGSEGGMTWLVDAPGNGEYKLTWRYTQEEGRDMALNVNCTDVAASVPFSITGSWNSNWKSDVTQIAMLKGGTNRIVLATNGGSGPNFDTLTLEMNFAPPTCKLTSGASAECEAERGLTIGSTGIANAGSGWTGTGYADMFGKEGGVTWVVDAPVAGTYALTFVYTQMEGRDMTLKVNGAQAVASVAFTNTGSWDSSWVRDVKTNVTLKAGLNAVTLATNGGSGPNFDKIIVLAPAAGDAGASVLDAGDAGGG